MMRLIFPGIEVVVVGDAFAHVVQLELLPDFSLRVMLPADATALRTINDSRSGKHVVFRHGCLPVLAFPSEPPSGYNIT